MGNTRANVICNWDWRHPNTLRDRIPSARWCAILNSSGTTVHVHLCGLHARSSRTEGYRTKELPGCLSENPEVANV